MNSERKFKKNTVIINQDEFTNNGYFVSSGIVCAFFEHDINLEVFEFYSSGMPIHFPIETDQGMSGQKLLCLTDVVIAESDMSKSEEVMREFPKFESICRQYAEQSLKTNFDFIHQLKHLKPLDRYQKFVRERADILEFAPQYLIASYLGVSPESLSRIRKRLS